MMKGEIHRDLCWQCANPLRRRLPRHGPPLCRIPSPKHTRRSPSLPSPASAAPSACRLANNSCPSTFLSSPPHPARVSRRLFVPPSLIPPVRHGCCCLAQRAPDGCAAGGAAQGLVRQLRQHHLRPRLACAQVCAQDPRAVSQGLPRIRLRPAPHHQYCQLLWQSAAHRAALCRRGRACAGLAQQAPLAPRPRRQLPHPPLHKPPRPPSPAAAAGRGRQRQARQHRVPLRRRCRHAALPLYRLWRQRRRARGSCRGAW